MRVIVGIMLYQGSFNVRGFDRQSLRVYLENESQK